MKTMTCSQMGGPCDVAMTAGTEDEMVKAGMAHVEEAHPDIAEQIKGMSEEDTKNWSAEFHEKWEAQPEDEEVEEGAETEGEEAEESEAPAA